MVPGVLLALALGVSTTPVQAGPSDPLLVFTPKPPKDPKAPPEPPPTGHLEGPCGLAVDSFGNFYVSDYYHEAVDVFDLFASYRTQLKEVDPLDGPCALALDSKGDLYVNNFHRNVEKFSPAQFPPIKGTPYTSVEVFDINHPTGVAVDQATDNVYVNDRTYIAAYEPSGTPVLDGGLPLKIGVGSLEDGYGLAVSEHPGTAGHLYVADAAGDTVEVYDPAIDKDDPVTTIDGPGGVLGDFVSLRDSALAVDRVTGNLYVTDNLQPKYTERPEAAIYVFGPTGNYLGRLLHNIFDALPPGLAVDNSATFTQGRVYVTSGNTIEASVIAYPPGAQTNAELPPLPPFPAEASGGGGSSSFASGRVGADCFDACRRLDPAPEARTSEVTQRGSLRLSVNGKLSPQKLPRDGVAPIAVSVGWKVATTDGSAVPKLRNLRIEINRHGRFDTTGLPTCPYNRIQPASSSRALANCREALVGQGSFNADIALKGQEPYATKGRLLVFNGEKGGKPVLFGQIYSPYPFATSFVIVFKVQKLGKGTYGTALSATLPKALASWGNLTGIEMRLQRRYTYAGKRRSYISAGCPAPKGFRQAVFPLARTSFGFAGEGELSSVFTSTCKARG